MHVQRDIVQLRLLGGAIHKRVAAPAAQRRRQGARRELGVWGARGAAACLAASCRGAARHTSNSALPHWNAHRPKSLSRSVWRPPRVAPLVRAAIVGLGGGAASQAPPWAWAGCREGGWGPGGALGTRGARLLPSGAACRAPQAAVCGGRGAPWQSELALGLAFESCCCRLPARCMCCMRAHHQPTPPSLPRQREPLPERASLTAQPQPRSNARQSPSSFARGPRKPPATAHPPGTGARSSRRTGEGEEQPQAPGSREWRRWRRRRGRPRSSACWTAMMRCSRRSRWANEYGRDGGGRRRLRRSRAPHRQPAAAAPRANRFRPMAFPCRSAPPVGEALGHHGRRPPVHRHQQRAAHSSSSSGSEQRRAAAAAT